MSSCCCCCAESTQSHKKYVVRLDNLKYDDERVLVKSIQQNYGVCGARVDLFSGTLTLEYAPDRISVAEIRQMVSSPDFLLELTPRKWVSSLLEKHGQTARLALSAALVVASWALLLARGEKYSFPDPLYMTVNLAAVLVAGTPTLTGLVRAAKTRQLSVAVLIGIAALSALALGDWLEAASVLLISVVGEALERQSLKRSHQDVFAVHMLGAKAALVKHEGKLVELPVHKVRRGQILVIRQGMKVPVDGTVKDGGGQVNEAALTGESAFRTKSPGDRVSAGTLLEAGALEIEAVSVGGDTAIAQIAKLVEKARHEKTAAEKMVDRFARLLIPAILLIAAGALAAKKRVSAES